VFPDEDEEEEENDMSNNPDMDSQFTGQHELNGIMITENRETETRIAKKKENAITGNIEQTKINFFDATKYDEANMPSEDQQIIEAKIDVQEWRHEVNSVMPELEALMKDIELIKTHGGGNSDLDEDIEEYRRHIELIIELSADIKRSCHPDTRKFFSKAAEKLEQDLEYIRKSERRINEQQSKPITKLNSIASKKKQVAVELRQIIDSVK